MFFYLVAVNIGALTTLIFGGLGYYIFNNLSFSSKIVYQSLIYKFINIKPINVNYEFVHRFNPQNNIFYTLFYRMPEKEYDRLYRFKRVEITGNFDHDKEVLIESCKCGEKGYNVYTPFYYYNNTYIDKQSRMIGQDGKAIAEHRILRGGITVHRGWYIYFKLQ